MIMLSQKGDAITVSRVKDYKKEEILEIYPEEGEEWKEVVYLGDNEIDIIMDNGKGVVIWWGKHGEWGVYDPFPEEEEED